MTTMSWFPTVVFMFGVLDAAVVIVGGAVLSCMCLFGSDKSLDGTLSRLLPAGTYFILSNFVACLVLSFTKWWIGA